MLHNIPEEQRHQQVIQLAIVNSFHHCDYKPELIIQTDVMSSIEEENYACHEEWIWLGNEDTDFGSYVSVEKELAGVTSGISELCDDHKDGKNSKSE